MVLKPGSSGSTSINEGRVRWLVESTMDTSTVASECGMLRSGGCCAVAMLDVLLYLMIWDLMCFAGRPCLFVV